MGLSERVYWPLSSCRKTWMHRRTTFRSYSSVSISCSCGTKRERHTQNILNISKCQYKQIFDTFDSFVLVTHTSYITAETHLTSLRHPPTHTQTAFTSTYFLFLHLSISIYRAEMSPFTPTPCRHGDVCRRHLGMERSVRSCLHSVEVRDETPCTRDHGGSWRVWKRWDEFQSWLVLTRLC